LYAYLFAGTHWITHKINALQLLVDKYGFYLQHLQNMSEDMSFKAVLQRVVKKVAAGTNTAPGMSLHRNPQPCKGVVASIPRRRYGYSFLTVATGNS
jgi:hypothetical protein